MDINIVLESFPEIVETVKMLLKTESAEEVTAWAVAYYTAKYHTNMESIVKEIVQHISN